MKNKRVKAPTGFFFRIIPSQKNSKKPNRVEVCLYDTLTRRRIGAVSLVRNYLTGSYVTHSKLDSSYHRKGLGTIMYARAIQWCLDNGNVVRSSGNSSDMAQRVWKSRGLRNFFSIRKRKHKLSSRYDTWYAYQR